MPTILGISPVEQGTLVITASFTDESVPPAAVIPTAGLNWTLTDMAGTVINSRSAVVIAPPAASVVIVLHGADLALSSAYEGTMRVLTIQGTYTSTLGVLELKGQTQFQIDALIAVPSVP